MIDNNPLKYSKHNPYNRYADYLRSIFGKRMQKISIDAGFTCPNIDGTMGKEGCIYCNNHSFNPNYHDEKYDTFKQIDQGINKYTNLKANTGFIGYFQSHTNTYGAVNELQKIYEEAASHPQIEGLIISTRPDCLSEPVLDLLEEMNARIFTGVEIGIESIHNKTLKKLNRGHTFEQTLDAIQRTKAHNLHLGGHLILGLPGETTDCILQSAETIAALPLDTIKLHQLQIIKNTALAQMYAIKSDKFQFFTLEEYINLCISFLERLNGNVAIERFASESKPELLMVRMWEGIKNYQIADKITNEMIKRNTFQGRLFKINDE